MLFMAFEGDIASMNIRERLLQMGRWERVGEVEGNPSYTSGEVGLITLKGEHLYREDLDALFEVHNPGGYPLLVILSRHSSASRIPTLTLHPTGNFSEALYGGRCRALSTSAPLPMRETLRSLRRWAEKLGLEHRVSYEVTHHGPLIRTPHFFVEIGSDEVMWRREDAAEAIAGALLETFPGTYREPEGVEVAVGVGGGHYAPRFTDIALKRAVAFGHMLPEYALEEAISSPEVIEEMVKRTPGAAVCYTHSTGRSKELVRRAASIIAQMGLEIR